MSRSILFFGYCNDVYIYVNRTFMYFTSNSYFLITSSFCSKFSSSLSLFDFTHWSFSITPFFICLAILSLSVIAVFQLAFAAQGRSSCLRFSFLWPLCQFFWSSIIWHSSYILVPLKRFAFQLFSGSNKNSHPSPNLFNF